MKTWKVLGTELSVDFEIIFMKIEEKSTTSCGGL